VREFRDLHPKRLAAGVFDDDSDDASGANKPTRNVDKASDAGKRQQPRQTFDPDLS
jgi:hypothetical protein